jgi:RNA polymerase sigma-70 factor, ECF subfamily
MSPPEPTNSHEVTRLLGAVRSGDPDAADRLAPLIYAELHEIASRLMGRERPDHTLQPTVLVHEAFVRLVGPDQGNWQDRLHFYRVAARAMRRILIDHGRRRRAAKRGGMAAAVTLDENLVAEAQEGRLDLDALDAALDQLAALAPRQAQVVELRAFAGLDVTEVAEALGTSPATVKRDWQFARAWLARALGGGEPAE